MWRDRSVTWNCAISGFPSPLCGESNAPASARVIGLVRGKAVSGRRTLTIPSKPRTGRFNARGRGRAALERGIGPKQGWRVHRATGDRYRARRAIVKVRVVKLRNAKSSVSRGHLAYLQREGAGVERVPLT